MINKEKGEVKLILKKLRPLSSRFQSPEVRKEKFTKKHSNLTQTLTKVRENTATLEMLRRVTLTGPGLDLLFFTERRTDCLVYD